MIMSPASLSEPYTEGIDVEEEEEEDEDDEEEVDIGSIDLVTGTSFTTS